MQEAVIITDVGPRDGLQSQDKILSVKERIRLIRALVAAGVPRIEIGSFVSPRAVPAMADTDRVSAGLEREDQVDYSALVPNLRGYELALEAGVRTVAMVAYASDGMARRNINKEQAEAMDLTAQILQRAAADGVKVITTIATAFECPFDGITSRQVVVDMARQCLEFGAAEVVIADTIGAAAPSDVRDLLDKLVSTLGPERMACHFHDTRAMGLANVYAALEAGIRRFDASIGGLGGCPFAPGASGNVATEDLVMMVEQMGYYTGVNQTGLMDASDLAEALTGSAPGGRAKTWLKSGHKAG